MRSRASDTHEDVTAEGSLEGTDTLGAKYHDPLDVGGQRIEARMAITASSRVYRAIDTENHRTTVVKILAPPHDEQVPVVQRFMAACEALRPGAGLHVVGVYGCGLLGRSPYAVLEFVDGEDLERALLREGTLLASTALRAVMDTASALHEANRLGVVHGDIRPRHLIRSRGTTRVIGFGMSPPVRTAQGRSLIGHPGYLAPEVAAGQAPSVHSDIYALGCTLYELVTGKLPFGNAGADATLACHAHEPFPQLRASVENLPHELDALLALMTHKNRDRRIQTPLEVVQAGHRLMPTLRIRTADDPHLVVEDGRQVGLHVPLLEGDLLIGRVPGEGLALDDARCSRRHATVRRVGDVLELFDLDSRNGVRVNGVDVKHRVLEPGDRVEIGDTVLRIEGPEHTREQTRAPHYPAMRDLPASPLRGAFGDVETVHPVAMQMTPERLADPHGPSAATRLLVLSRLAPLLAAKSGDAGSLCAEVLSIVKDALGADEAAVVGVATGRPVFAAKSGREAQVLSATLPALERALPGGLALATSVRSGASDLNAERWAVILAPERAGQQVVRYLLLVKRQGAFPAEALSVLEGACGLLSLRGATQT